MLQGSKDRAMPLVIDLTGQSKAGWPPLGSAVTACTALVGENLSSLEPPGRSRDIYLLGLSSDY